MNQKQWYRQQLRIVQTVLREPDIINYDAVGVVRYLEDVGANCIIINAGGIVDFFDNKVELANPNIFMTNEDILRDLTEEAHKKNIKVMVRVDFRGVEGPIYQQKPHWFSLTSDGKPLQRNDFHLDLYLPCFNGEYKNGHAVRYIKNLMAKYDIDGIWQNSVGSYGACYCEACRDLYRKEIGKDIPVHHDFGDPIFDEYRLWKSRCADRHIRLIRDTVKSFGDEKAYAAEVFGMFHARIAKYEGIDLYNGKKYFDFMVSPTFLTISNTKRNYDILSYPASTLRFMKALDPEKQAVALYGNNGTRWRYVKDPTVESRIWLWEAASVGGGLWNCMFNGQHPAATFDNRNAFIEKDVYIYLKDNSKILEMQNPFADVGIFYSKPTRDTFAADNEDTDRYGVFIKGVERVMTGHHIQYTFCPDLDFTLERIKKLKLLILPNTACLSDDQIQIIKTYVQQGGSIIASFETSLYDEKGKKRSDFGLAELFGCTCTGITRDTSNDCYQLLNEMGHPILEGFTGTSLIMNSGETLLCKPLKSNGYSVICSYVPVIHNQPPEKAWIKDMRAPYPTVVAGEYGKGRVVYFSNQTDKLCHTNGHEDFIDIYYNAIRWAVDGKLTIATDAPSSVHMALTHDREVPGSYLLSLINLTSSPERPVRRLVPVYDFNITLHIKGSKLNNYRVLKQEGDISLKTTYKSANELELDIGIAVLKEFSSIHLEVQE